MPVEPGVLAQDPLLKAAQLRARVDAKLRPELVSELGVGAQRVRLAAAPVQGQDPLPGKALPQRVTCGQALQLGDQAGVPATRQVGIDPAFQGGQPGFFQAPGVGLREGHLGHVRQGRAAPQVKGLAQGSGGSFGPGRHVRIGRPDQALEAGGIELVLADVEPVTVRLGQQGAGVPAQDPAQPGYVDPQRGGAVCRRAARP